MPVAQAIDLQVATGVSSDTERLVDQLANRIGGLGVELADVAGNLQEVAGPRIRPVGTVRSPAKDRRNHGVRQSRHRKRVAGGSIGRDQLAVSEITQSRGAVDTAVGHIAELVEAVGRIEHRSARSDRAGGGSQGLGIDRGDRQANQPACFERDHRGRPRG